MTMTERFQPVESELPDSVGPTTLPKLEAMAEAKKLDLQKVTWVHHWTHGLFSFRIGRRWVWAALTTPFHGVFYGQFSSISC